MPHQLLQSLTGYPGRKKNIFIMEILLEHTAKLSFIFFLGKKFHEDQQFFTISLHSYHSSKRWADVKTKYKSVSPANKCNLS